jgi:hypothetical protein
VSARPDVAEAGRAAASFGFAADAAITPVLSGHVNESFHVRGAQGDALLQWLSTVAFADPLAVQANVERVVVQLARAAPERCWPALLSTAQGAGHVQRASGLWRAWSWLPDRVTVSRPDSPARAAAGGAAFAAFVRALEDLPGPTLALTLPGFHALDRRLAQLEAALADADAARIRSADDLLETVARRRVAYLDGVAGRSRILHGDPKFGNLLFGVEDPPVVIDYDTVMYGPLAWDFGDFLRSAATTGDEDVPEAVALDEPLLEAAARGYLSAAPAAWREEQASLAHAPGYIAFTLGVRFLTDHLAGDRYFRVTRPRQNLDRARTQLRLAAAFDAARGRLEAILRALARSR